MITCPNCKKELEDGTKFCNECGTQLEVPVETAQVEEVAQTEEPVAQEEVPAVEEAISGVYTAPVEEPKKEKEKKNLLSDITSKVPKNVLIFGGVGVLAVVVLFIILVATIANSGSNNAAIYVKDGEIYYTGISRIKPIQITTALYEGEGDGVSASEGDTLGLIVQTSKDGKIICFPDKIDTSSDGYSLYYRYTKRPKKEPVKIDADVAYYSLSEDGKKVTYINADGDLYQHNLKEKEKVDSDVDDYRVTSDGKKLIFNTDEGDLYYKNGKKDKEKIDDEVDDITYVSEDFSLVYYEKDDELYMKKAGKDKKEIASGVSDVITVYEDGAIYYTKSDSESKTLSEFVEDDLAESDAALTEPVAPDYPYSWDFDTIEEYNAAKEAYDSAYEEYQTAYEEYSKKTNRDYMRENLKNSTVDNTTYSLCYYNGKKETVVTDKMTSSDCQTADDKAVCIIKVSEGGEVGKIKISEIESTYDVEEFVNGDDDGEGKPHVVIKDKMTAVEQEDAQDFIINDAGDTIFFMNEVSDTTGELYKMEVSGKLGKAEKYDSEVSTSYSRFITDDKFMYAKETEESSEGDLYINKDKIDSEVNIYSVEYNEEAKAYTYFCDGDTLKTYRSGKPKKIADDVEDFAWTPKGQVLYLSNYDDDSNEGELYVYKNGKGKKIDDEVSAIVGTGMIRDLASLLDSYY